MIATNLTMNSVEEKKEKNIETIKIILNTQLPKPTRWNDKKKILSFKNHYVLLGYLNAYFDHCPIKVSPNIIWQLILNAFSKYVNDNSEYHRDKFVDFLGKKQLLITRRGTFDDIKKYEKDIIEEFCQKISENIGGELVDILTPNFTTSTEDTIIAGKVTIMSTFKNYFIYKILMISCGIPYILLEGTLEDWEKLLQKLEFLQKYDFDILQMKKNIEEIINTKKGDINYDFWRKIIMETKETVNESSGCSFYLFPVEKNIIKGWICDFYPSMKKNITLKEVKDKLVNEVQEVPVIIKQLETGQIINAKIYTGIGDIKQDQETFIVEPIVNYSFSIFPTDNQIGL